MKNPQKIKRNKRIKRHQRKRAKIFGTKDRPRLSVFRSNQHLYCQLIDDEKQKTLAAASDLELKEKKTTKKKEEKEEKKPFLIGKLVAQKAKEQGIKKVVFDAGGYKYHGKIKSLAQGAREEGLKF